jgi:hypothetical protein
MRRVTGEGDRLLVEAERDVSLGRGFLPLLPRDERQIAAVAIGPFRPAHTCDRTVDRRLVALGAVVIHCRDAFADVRLKVTLQMAGPVARELHVHARHERGMRCEIDQHRERSSVVRVDARDRQRLVGHRSAAPIAIPTFQRRARRAHDDGRQLALCFKDHFRQAVHHELEGARVVNADLRHAKRVGRIDRAHVNARVRMAGEQNYLILSPAMIGEAVHNRRLQRRRESHDVHRNERELSFPVGQHERLGKDGVEDAFGGATHAIAIAAQWRSDFQGRRQVDARHPGVELGRRGSCLKKRAKPQQREGLPVHDAR